MAEQDAMDPGGEHLFDHPGVGPHGDLVRAVGGQRDDDGGSAVPAPGRASLDEPAHELSQRADVERSVLHVVVDVVGPGLGHFLAGFEIGGHALVAAGVVDRLSLAQQIDRLVDPLWGLSGGDAGGQQQTQCSFSVVQVVILQPRRIIPRPEEAAQCLTK